MHGRHNLHFKVAAAYIFIEGRMRPQVVHPCSPTTIWTRATEVSSEPRFELFPRCVKRSCDAFQRRRQKLEHDSFQIEIQLARPSAVQPPSNLNETGWASTAMTINYVKTGIALFLTCPYPSSNLPWVQLYSWKGFVEKWTHSFSWSKPTPETRRPECSVVMGANKW